MMLQSLIFSGQQLTFPTKVPSDSLGWIGSLKRTSDKSLFPMALGSCGHRITHQLRPINMNGRSILAVTSTIGVSSFLANFFSEIRTDTDYRFRTDTDYRLNSHRLSCRRSPERFRP